MASGKVHDLVGLTTTLSLAGLGQVAGYPGEIIGFYSFVGYLYFSPDLDISHSVVSKRWLFLKDLWCPYRLLVGHHRSFMSHSYLISSAIRVVYFLLILWIIVNIIYFDNADKAIKITNAIFTSDRLIAIFIAFEIQTSVHLFLDHFSTWCKKHCTPLHSILNS